MGNRRRRSQAATELTFTASSMIARNFVRHCCLAPLGILFRIFTGCIDSRQTWGGSGGGCGGGDRDRDGDNGEGGSVGCSDGCKQTRDEAGRDGCGGCGGCDCAQLA